MTIYVQKEKNLKEKTDDSSRIVNLDFSAWLPTGVTVSSVTWESDPTGLTFSSESLASNIATVTISGGYYNNKYKAKCQATLSNGEIEERSLDIKVVEHKDV